jgi:hypothetical protein
MPMFHCQACNWVGTSDTAAAQHECGRHDGATTCWPQDIGSARGAMRAAWQQRCTEDENWPWGLGCWEAFDWLHGTWLYRLTEAAHRTAYTLKTIACLALGRRRTEPARHHVVVAITGCRWVPLIEEPYSAWTELTVSHGWRPRTWKYAINRESS